MTDARSLDDGNAELRGPQLIVNGVPKHMTRSILVAILALSIPSLACDQKADAAKNDKDKDKAKAGDKPADKAGDKPADKPVEPAKPAEPTKAEPAADPAKAEPAADPAKAEPAADPAKPTEPAKAEPAKADAPK